MPERLTPADPPGHPGIDRIVDIPEGSNHVEPTFPPAGLFIEEWHHWRGEFDKADREGDAFLRAVSQGLVETLRDIGVKGRMAMAAAEKMGMTYPLKDEWYAMSAAIMAYSRMIRTDALGVFGEGTPGFGFRADSTIMGLDFSEQEPDKSGVHLHNDRIAELGISPIAQGEEVWLEGEQVFIRARRPAEPSQIYVEGWEHFYGEDHPFERLDYTSFVPRLKREFWDPTSASVFYQGLPI